MLEAVTPWERKYLACSAEEGAFGRTSTRPPGFAGTRRQVPCMFPGDHFFLNEDPRQVIHATAESLLRGL